MWALVVLGLTRGLDAVKQYRRDRKREREVEQLRQQIAHWKEEAEMSNAPHKPCRFTETRKW